MKILVINAGSSSLKYQLFNMENASVMAGGVIERIGEKKATLIHKFFLRGRETKLVKEQEIKNHKIAMHMVADLIIDPEKGVIDDIADIDAVGHRVVHGGETFSSAIIIDEMVKQTIKENSRFAPLHNPPNLTGIEVAQQIFCNIPNIAVFDTEFHQTMPVKAYLYALPYEYYEKYKVRKYGFHGTSHKYVTHKAAKLLRKDTGEVNLITIHLGNGCSMCAVKNGKCVDTSMGMTPLAGIMMGTRTGDIDPAIIGYLMEQTNMDIRGLDSVLNNSSGFKGICGMNDMRDIHEQASKGNNKAKLAVEMFSYQVKKYIGSYMAVLGKVDALVFTAGVGEIDDFIRYRVCKDLSFLGIDIDPEKNSQQPSPSMPFFIHTEDAHIQVWVIPTNEELQIARDVLQVLQ